MTLNAFKPFLDLFCHNQKKCETERVKDRPTLTASA